MENEKLENLIERVVLKDQEAFLELYHFSYPYVYKYVREFGLYYCDVDDVIQMVFINVYHKLYQLRNPCCYFKWLYMVARSEFHNFACKFYQIKMVEIHEDHIDYQTEETNTSTNSLNQTLREEAVRDALQKLSTSTARILALRYLKELSMKEIAQIEHVPEGTIKSKLYRARLKLKSLPDAERFLPYL